MGGRVGLLAGRCAVSVAVGVVVAATIAPTAFVAVSVVVVVAVSSFVAVSGAISARAFVAAVVTIAVVVAVAVVVVVVVVLVVAIAVVVVVAIIAGGIVVAHTAFTAAEHHVAIGRECARAALCPTRAGIAHVDIGPVVVEIVGPGVVGVDGEDKPVAAPREWTEEVVGRAIEGILPVEEDVAEVGIAKRPVVAEDIVAVVNGEEIVEVHLIATVVLFGREVQFVGHFVGQEVGVFAGFPIAHGVEGRGGDKEDEGEQKSFHNV